MPEPFTVCLRARVRPCREEDLPALEWFGLFAGQRALIRRVFEQHCRGQAHILVAEVNGAASGQLWIDATQPNAGELWAVRVLPCLQGQGIGTRLVAEAERWLRTQGRPFAQLAVERDNPHARRFYERLGYRVVGEAWSRAQPEAAQVPSLQWWLTKELNE